MRRAPWACWCWCAAFADDGSLHCLRKSPALQHRCTTAQSTTTTPHHSLPTNQAKAGHKSLVERLVLYVSGSKAMIVSLEQKVRDQQQQSKDQQQQLKGQVGLL